MYPTEPIYFAHISDTHFGPTPGYERHGARPYPNAVALVETLNNLPTPPDFVVHTGDVATHPEAAAYALAKEVLGQLQMPVYYVNGNHDTAAFIRQYLEMGSRQDLSANGEALSYVFTVKGYRFLVLDARGPEAIDPHGLLSQEQLALVRAEARPEGPPLTIFVHFPAHPLNSIWMDTNMLIVNGAELHQALLPARERLRAVFYGHVHQSMQTMRDGILYVAAASAFAQFNAWPEDVNVRYDAAHPPGYNFVHLLPQQTIIHQHVVGKNG